MRGLLVTSFCALALAAPAGANAPLHFSFPVDETHLAPGTSRACGFPVYVHTVGSSDVQLFFNGDGLVVKEIDENKGSTTYFAPSRGTSFSFPAAGHLITTYPEGATVGAPASADASGFADKIPGVGADAGHMSFDAVVVGFVGPIPDIDAIDAELVHGTFGNNTAAARCVALAG